MIAAIARPHVDWFAFSPELILLGVSLLCLLVAVLVPDAARRAVSATLAFGGFVGAFVVAAVLYDRSGGESVIAGAIRRDRYAALAAIIVAGAGARRGARLVQRAPQGPRRRVLRAATAAGGGMIFLAAANNLMTLFLGLEWFSISLYILCAIDRERERSLEAGLKYLIVGGFGSRRAALRLGARLRRDRRAAVREDRGRDSARRAWPRHDAPPRPRDDHRRARVQGLGGAVPHVDARRLRGRADVR